MLRESKVNLGYTIIRSPINGRISKHMWHPGNVVEANKTVLTNIVTLDPIYATFYVDERTRLRVTRLVETGKVKSARVTEIPVKMSLADEERFTHTGTINFVDNQVDPQTGTLRVRGLFRNLRVPPTMGARGSAWKPRRWGWGRSIAGATLIPSDTDIGQLLTKPFMRVQVPIGAHTHKALLVIKALLGIYAGPQVSLCG